MGKIANFFIASEQNNYRPPMLTYKAFIIYGLILLILRIILGSLYAQGSAIESTNLMNLINKEREQRNLNTLFVHQSLMGAAAQKSQDMIDRDYFAHVNPDGQYVWPKITAAGYSPYKILGENLAVDFSTAEGMIKAWIDSPTHRANLLHADFVDQGVAALYGDFKDRYTNLTTSLFGTLASYTAPQSEVKSEDISTAPPPTALPAAPEPSPAPPPTPIPSPAPAPKPQPLQAPPPQPEPAPPETIQEEPSAVAQPEVPRLGLTPLQASRIIFTLFGLFLLVIFSIDSVIVYQHEAAVARSHPGYHFFGFMLIVLVSILIWWW